MLPRSTPCSIVLAVACACAATAEVHAQAIADSDSAPLSSVASPFPELARQYCFDCHNPEERKGRLDLTLLLEASPAQHRDQWEQIVWMLKEREMPPIDAADAPRPSNAAYDASADWLSTWLDRAAPGDPMQPEDTVLSSKHAVVSTYCVSCHDADDPEGQLVLEGLTLADATEHPAVWEKVVRRLNTRQMPPAERPKRPSEATYQATIDALVHTLDEAARKHPDPGRTETFRRLNRTEYQNAIRDLLGLDIDSAQLLPPDEASHGFDNVTVGNLSPTLLDRYISAAQKISRLAVGAPRRVPEGETIRLPADRTQEKHVEGLPLGTRGGALVNYYFPGNGEYEIRVRLTRDRNENVEGLRESHELDLLLDDELIQRFTVAPDPDRQDDSMVDQHLAVRIPVKAGPRRIGVAFPAKTFALQEGKRQPFEAHFNLHRHPRLTPAVYQISITGPHGSSEAGDTPSRSRIFVTTPARAGGEEAAAREILGTLLRRAYRRPVSPEDLERPMTFFRETAATDGFEAGIEMALSAILVSPQFLFRIETDPADATPGTVYAVSELDLASRLSFFLWSSIPDDELIDLASRGRLREPAVFEGQVRRMLADPRSSSLVANFASQWLYLRNLDSATPNLRLFPDFDDNLRQAFRTETELFVQSILREDRSIMDLIDADYTFLNERLARHYRIPHILGSRFRRIQLEPGSHRGGLLRQGSILTITSYATRTSPVIRGNWILENIVGTPPPPPPPDIPSLDGVISEELPMRERLAQHRADPACATCHSLMDPIGFALENFDAVGRWRETEEGTPIDVTGGLPDGSTFLGIDGLEQGLLQRPDIFAATLSEKLLTFALGRGVGHYDAPAVRQIVRESAARNYRFSDIILGITRSVPFQMRKSL